MASRGPIVPFDTSWEAVEPSSRPRPPAQPQFPAGLRILVVDDDIVCLRVIEQMLKLCLYHVTTSNRAGKALEILRQGSREFDLIISDLHMPDMDGFKLLELVGLEMDLPVIMMSADDGRDVVMKGIKHGACDYLLKPVSMEALKNIWQHVVRKKRNNELKELENSGSAEDGDRQKRVLEDNEYTSSNEGNQKSVKRRKDEREEEVEEERDDSSAVKKQRVVWSIELHQEFVDAVDKLGVEKAVPKKILEMMNVPGLTRENVASHLQKYRLYLRRLSAAQKQNRVDTHFSGTPEAYSSITSLDGYSLQPFAASGCSPPQSILTLHPGSRGATNIGMDMPIAGQKVFLNSYVQKASPAIAQPQPVNNKQMSTNGLSAYMEPGQFGMKQRQFVETQGFVPSSLQTSSPFYQGAINGHLNNASVMQIPQQGQHISSSHQLSTGHLVNETVNEYDSREQTISSGILKNVLSRNRAAVNGELSQGNYINTSYGTSPQVFYAANYQNSFINGSVGNSHLLAFSTGASDIKPSSMINGVTSATERSDDAYSMKRVENDFPNYHILFDPPQGQDWKLQNVNLSYESGQQLEPQQNHIDFGPSISTHQDFDAILKGGTGRNTCTLRKEVFSITTEIEPHKVACVAQHNGAVHVENSARLREVVPDSSCQNEFDNLPNDVMNIIGCQQQVFGQDEHDYMLDMFLS